MKSQTVPCLGVTVRPQRKWVSWGGWKAAGQPQNIEISSDFQHWKPQKLTIFDCFEPKLNPKSRFSRVVWLPNFSKPPEFPHFLGV